MSDELPVQPPNGTVPAQPSTDNSTAEVVRLTKELAAKTRAYEGLEGNFKTIKTERDTFERQLKDAAQTYEGEKITLKTEKDTLQNSLAQIQTELEQLKGSQGKVAEESEALKTLLTEFPDLVLAYSKRLIRVDGLKGDELKTYLAQWRDSAGVLMTDNTQQRNNGTVPPAPNPAIGSMTLEEAGEKKLDALRQFGPKSKVYQQYAEIESQLIRGLPYVPPPTMTKPA